MTDARSRPGRIASSWWNGLRPQTDRPGDPAALARLRRAHTPLEAATEAATIRLYRALPEGNRFDPGRMARVAALAAVLAYVREDLIPRSAEDAPRKEGPDAERADGETERTFRRPPRVGALARRLGGDGNPEHAPLTQARLSRLIAARDEAEVLRGFREAVALLRGRAEIGELAEAILDWTHPHRAAEAKARFVYHYHGAEAPAGVAPE